MRSTQITIHETDALNRLLYQYKGKPYIDSLIKDICTTQIQELEDAIIPLFNRLDIDASEGVQLDEIGEIVGQSRLGLLDATYRLFLKAKIGANVSEGDIPRVIDVWKLITNANLVQLLEAYPAEVDLYYDVPLDSSLTSLAFDLIQKVAGAGIAVGFIAVFENGNAFTLDGDVAGDHGTDDENAGFSGLSQGTNTSVSSLKLIDSGATFVTDGVGVGAEVANVDGDTDALVTEVVDGTTLKIDTDIFTLTGKNYYVANSNTGGKLSYLQAAQ